MEKFLHPLFALATVFATTAVADTLITNREGLVAIASNLAGSYALCADIDLDGEDWTPIGKDVAPFTGEFHGNGHVIRNLVCTNNPSANSCRGLFGCASNATIEAVSVSGTVSGKQYVGGYSAAFTGEFYGQGHRILGYVVRTGNRYAGLFGKIAGGRVSGVGAEGFVFGGPTVLGSDVGVGGFAGKIDSKSLVEGCSFDGEVANTNSVNAGGFVGYTTDSPVIIRCRAWGMVDNSSSKSGTGGFVGNHSGGSITDCCALMECTATDNGDASAGGFAGAVASATRIANSWCSGCVNSRGGYVGAFVGKANGRGLVTGSYYDNSANGLMEAVGKNAGGSTAYTGIAPVSLNGKFKAASYPSFDFTNTWSIAEGVDEPRLVPSTGFSSFLDDCCLPLGTKPGAKVNGIPAGARYVFGITPATGPSGLAEPLIDIKFDAYGKPYVKLPAIVNNDGATVNVLATEDISDWSRAAEYPVDAVTGICIPAIDPVPPNMFFKWRIDVAANSED